VLDKVGVSKRHFGLENNPLAYQFRVASEVDIGLVRESNQDMAYAWAKNPAKAAPVAVLIVSDGIGGYRAGEVASELATISVGQSLVSYLEENNLKNSGQIASLEARLRSALIQANLFVRRYAKEHLDGAEMGCTLTCVILHGLEMIIGHVGDSRAYLLRTGRIRQLSVDHTTARELYDLGEISEHEMLFHPKRHILTRAVGISPLLEMDILKIEVCKGARILLCTDGIWGYVPEITIERLLSRPGPPKSISRSLIAAANAYGGFDNIGVAICDIHDPDLHRF